MDDPGTPCRRAGSPGSWLESRLGLGNRQRFPQPDSSEVMP